MTGARQILVEDGWIGDLQLEIDDMCTKVRKLCIQFSETRSFHTSKYMCMRVRQLWMRCIGGSPLQR